MNASRENPLAFRLLTFASLCLAITASQQANSPNRPSEGDSPIRSSAPQFSVNLNQATPAEIEALPSIGPTLAKRITETREKMGRFTNKRQLEDVRGIGPRTLSQLGDMIHFEPNPK